RLFELPAGGRLATGTNHLEGADLVTQVPAAVPVTVANSTLPVHVVFTPIVAPGSQPVSFAIRLGGRTIFAREARSGKPGRPLVVRVPGSSGKAITRLVFTTTAPPGGMAPPARW